MTDPTPLLVPLAATAFDWRPGALEWMLVVELVCLATLAGARYIAALLGRNAPSDPFVIFHRVLWAAMRRPWLHPVPVNYRPVPPRQRKGRPVVEPPDEAGRLTEQELEELVSLEQPESSPAPTPEPTPFVATVFAAADDGPLAFAFDEEEPDDADPAPSEPAGLSTGGGTRQATLRLRVTSGPALAAVAFAAETLTVTTDLDPADGRANAAVLGLVVDLLGVRRHQVALLDGHLRPDKNLRVSGLTPAQVRDRLVQRLATGRR